MIDLDGARYVALTTFKRDGSPVATPVWITGSNGTYAFTTGDNAWKSKRLHNNPKVTVQVSDFRGRVKPNTRVYNGMGQVDPSAEGIVAVERELTEKYSWQFKLTQLTDAIKVKLGKTPKQHVVAIHLTVDVA